MPTSGSPALRAPGVFTNYAIGRARARQCATVPAACPGGQYPFGVVDLTFEMSHFMADFGGTAPPDHLYVMWIGGNDLNDALIALETDNTGATSVAIIQAAVASEASSLQALYAAGARTFLIPSAVNFALSPYVRSLGPTAQFVATQFAAAYNGGLDQVVAASSALPGIKFIRFDGNALFAQIEAQPAAFGITDALDSCLTFDAIGDAICATPNRYLFWDGIHPTAAGHRIIADAALQVLTH
jgi:phospholipase/lecithinase/hemolysin